MGPPFCQDATWQASQIVGSVCRNSPEERYSKISPWSADSQQIEKGEKSMRIIFAVALCLVASVSNAGAQQTSNDQKPATQDSHTSCPMHDAHAKMNERGEKGMGFAQTDTAHHFFLNSSGGVIQIEVKDSADVSDRTDIRMHLTHIAQAFQNGDFDIPMFVHDTVPPGVPEMKKLREQIHYSFEETPNGGRVVISSTNKEALTVIHSFLRFQIEEHKTGDPTEIR
jgi:hypothetical protein